MSIDKKQPSQPATADLGGLIAELRQRRDALESAEPRYEQQGTQLTSADKHETASRVGAKQHRKVLDDTPQAIHDRVRNARLDLQETLRRLTLAVGVRAVRDEMARVVLEQLKQLPPLPIGVVCG